jgi:PAS domain S-box-containing protein
VERPLNAGESSRAVESAGRDAGREVGLRDISRTGLSPDPLKLGSVLAALATVIGALILIGWLAGLPLLTSWLPGLVNAKPNAGLCLVLLGLAVALMPLAGSRAHRTAYVLAAAVVAISGATLFEYASGTSLGIDQVLATDTLGVAPYPNRFAFQVGLALLAAAAAVLVYGRRFRSIGWTELLALTTGVIGVAGLFGYAYGSVALRDLGSTTQVSLPASVGLVSIACGLLVIDPGHATVRLMWDPGTAGQLLRRFVPVALLVVPAGAWLRLQGERAGLFDEATGLAVLVAFESLILAAVGAWTVGRTQRLEAERSRANVALAALGAASSTPLIETAPIGLAVLDRDLRFLYSNPALARMNGLDAMAHLGQRIDRVLPGISPDIVRFLEGVAQRGEPVREIDLGPKLGSGGSSGRLLMSAEPLRDSSGEIAGVAVSVVEVAEPRHRDDAAAAVAEMRRQARAIGESIPYGIWIAEPDGQMQYLSDSFLSLIGIPMDEARGFGWMRAIAPESAADTMRDWRDTMAAGRPWNYELVIAGPNRGRQTVLSRGMPIRDDQGRVTSWAGINLDITDRKDAETFRDAFVGILSHELRTPVTSIYAASTLLERPGLDDVHRDGLVEDISHEAERLRRLVEDLLVLAKSERGAIQVRTEPVLLQHILPRVCDQERARWPEQRIELSVPARLPVARAEEAFVEQIVRNLLENAGKYGAPGEPIEVIADAPDGWPRIRVLDRGPGVDPEEAERLFELFYRSERTARIAGSGIGLFVAHRLVESIGGSIWAKPRDPGPGAEFGFQLQPVPEDL